MSRYRESIRRAVIVTKPRKLRPTPAASHTGTLEQTRTVYVHKIFARPAFA